MGKYSNTTLVKVKSGRSLVFLRASHIQIQLLLKLNLKMFGQVQAITDNSNTTLVKVKC